MTDASSCAADLTSYAMDAPKSSSFPCSSLAPARGARGRLRGGGAAARAEGRQTPLGNERLSNERTLTRWAHTNLLGAIRSKPATASKTVGKLRWNTEDGLPEVYIALQSRLDEQRPRLARDPHPRPAERPHGLGARGAALQPQDDPDPPDDRPRQAQGDAAQERQADLELARSASARPARSPRRAASGSASGSRNLGGSPIYGPWAFGTSAYSDTLTDWPGGGVIGIHGTNQPELIPGRPSHGCVRVPNAKINRLAKLMPVGTPIRIK